MRILWVPHCSWEKARTRDQYLIEKLRSKHEVHVLDWTQPMTDTIQEYIDPRLHLKGLIGKSRSGHGVCMHRLPRLQNNRFTPFFLSYNGKMFEKEVRRIVNRHEIDVVVTGPSSYLTGLPPEKLGVPMVFDHVDFVPDIRVREWYLKRSDAVMCVSHSLLEMSKLHNENSFYIPNAVNIEDIRRGKPEKVIEKHDLQDHLVIGLIGLSCNDDYYFIDSFRILKKRLGNIKMLIVGQNHHLPGIKAKGRDIDDIIFTGWVDNVEDYFAATDVGIYPVAKTLYDDCRCPIKVLEFTAAKKPVVSASINEVRIWGFPNVLLSEAEPVQFAERIEEATRMPLRLPDLSEFEIGNVTERLDRILQEVCKK